MFNVAYAVACLKLICECTSPRSYTLDQDAASGLELNAGINVVVFKVVNLTRYWQGSLWFTDAAGQPLKGIKVTLEPPP